MLKSIVLLGLMCMAGCARAETNLDDYRAQPRHAADAVVAYGPAPSQQAELFLPQAAGPHPVVLLIHGGCWVKPLGGIELNSAMAADLAARGYAVWNVEYRRLGEAGAGYPGTFQDIGAATDRLRAEAARYHLDLSRVVAVGHSAGGHLALWAAARGRLPKTSPLHVADPLRIGAVVSLAGAGDLEADAAGIGASCGPRTIGRLTGQPRADAFADTSPAALLSAGVRGVMIHGDEDEIFPSAMSVRYAAKARAAGDPAETRVIEGAGHFDLVIPTTKAWRIVVDAIDHEMKAMTP